MDKQLMFKKAARAFNLANYSIAFVGVIAILCFAYTAGGWSAAFIVFKNILLLVLMVMFAVMFFALIKRLFLIAKDKKWF